MEFIKKCLRASVLVILVGLVTSGVLAYGQATSATLNGTITDTAGASIPGVQVEVKNINTGVQETVTTNETGYYSAALLPPGQYTAAVQKTGFRKSVQTGIILTVGQVATVNIALAVGDVKETVTVTANEELINTTTADLGATINSQAVSELPLNGRDPSALVLLTPGVASISARMDGNKVATNQTTNSLSTPTGGSLEWSPSSGGGRQGSVYFTLDGTTNMDAYLLTGLPSPNSDATQEFRVVSNGFDAQYGFSPNGVVLIQTKSGTNAYHGGAFEFIRNNDLNAASYFGKAVNGLKRNQFGGFAGGPIFKNKLFFFANYQDTRTNSQANNSSSNFPTTAMRAGDFSAITNICKPGANSNCLNWNAYNLYGFSGSDTSVTPNPNQVELTDAKALAFVNNNMPTLTPCASTGLNIPGCQDPVTGQMYFSNPPTTSKYSENTDRIDWTINDKQRAFVRSYILYLDNVGGAVAGNISAVANGQTGELYNETVGHTWMINDSTVNNFAAGWLQENTLAQEANKQKDGSPLCLSEYMAVSDPKGECFLTLYQWGGGGSNWTEPISQRRTTWSLTDSLSKTEGNLTLTSGLDLHKQFSEEDTTYPANGLVWGGSGYTGDGLADLLLGKISGFSQGGGEVVPLKGWQFGLFAQTQYKIKPNLTVSFGVRWDPDTPPSMVNGYGAVFSPGAQSLRFPNAPLGILFPGDAGVSKALMPKHMAIFEPRLGVNWQPKFLPNTAIRAGLGQFSGPIVYNYYNHAVDIPPFSPEYQPGVVWAKAYNPDGVSEVPIGPMSFDSPWTASNGDANCPAPCTGTPYANSAQPDPFQAPNGGFASVSYQPASNSTFATPIGIGSSFAPDFSPAITTTWSLSVEHEFPWNLALHLAYVGSNTDHAMIDVDANPKSNDLTIPGYANTRAYSNFGEVDVDRSNGTSSYNSMQTGLEKKFSHGLQFQSNFTWSKVLDEASIGSVTVSNPYDLRWNYGISYINIPFSWVSNFIYTTPALRNSNPILRAVLGTWQVSTIYTAQSGQPFEVGGSNNVGEGSAHADRVPGQSLKVRQGGRANWINNYYNTAAFTREAQGTFGYQGKNIMVGPPLNYADSSFSKNWKYSRYTVQLRVDMFNTFNHPSFGLPDSNSGDANYAEGGYQGRITGNGPEGPRLMQGDLKFTF